MRRGKWYFYIWVVCFWGEGCPEKILPSFPAPSTSSFQPACLGRDVARAAGGGRGREGGLGLKSRPPTPWPPPTQHPSWRPPLLRLCREITSDAMDRLCSRCPLAGYPRLSVLMCLLVSAHPLSPKSPTWELREEDTLLFTARGILSWEQAGRGWTVKSLEAPLAALEIVVWF